MRPKLSTIAIAALAVVMTAFAACSRPGPAPAASPSSVVPQAAPTFALTGHVVDLLGAPVADGTVVVTAGAAVGAHADVASGLFTLTGLPAGTLNLLVSSSHYDPRTLTVSITRNDSVTVVMTGNLNFGLSGVVTRADNSAPMAGLTVFMNGLQTGITDAAGHYQLKGELDSPLADLDNYVFANADGFDDDLQYIRSSTRNLRLYPTRRFEIGQAEQVTVAPDDAVCANNTQEIGYGDVGYVCRTVHTTAPSNGVLTVEVVSAAGDHFPLVVQTQGHECCDQQFKNPESFTALAGADVIIFVELPESAPGSQTFTVKTAFSEATPEPVSLGAWLDLSRRRALRTR